MKRFLSVLMVVILSVSVFIVPVSANNELSVVLNGEPLEFDVQPQIINGRTMVPMRKIFEELGATVDWDGSIQKITAKKQDITVVMQINSNILSVNGNNVTLDVPPQLVNGRTLVPVRAVAESFDIHVLWDEVYNNVVLSTYIPLETSIQAFNYLGAWLLENGKVFGEYVYVGWEVVEGVNAEIRCYPESGNIAFYLDSYQNDGIMTAINIWPTYDGNDVYATYISGSQTCRIDGNINMAMHTPNYPLAYRECEPGEFETTYNLLDDTRERINVLLNEVDLLLAFENSGVNLNTLGFKKY
ncbi:MAG: copper amine oxidase N-terminal domain-containing protein [Clostridia bacterium]|nr:copper amine oxidase N-terminal domain-containing protein [Clostridia bacterium]